MNRRQFIQKSAAFSISAVTLACQRVGQEEVGIVRRLIRQNDIRLKELTKRQQKSAGHQWCGGISDRYGIYSSGLTAGFIRDLTCAYCAPESAYFQSREMLNNLDSAIQFLLNRQHDDGTIDLETTNFHSTPDTGFVLEKLCGAYGLLKINDNSSLEATVSKLGRFIVKAAEALTVGGIHTPNHRWVVCMALARVFSLFPNGKYVQRIDEWLSEHIDIDGDGQFTEKSTAIYSPLTDRCLITMARLLNRVELYEPVRKNLNMTLYYIHPNGEVVTEVSKRQDKDKFRSMAAYYYPYRYLSRYDHNGQFAAMTNWIEERPQDLTGNLMFLLEDKSLTEPLPASLPLPTNYEKYFTFSNVARIRRDHISATILADSFTLLSYRKGEAILRALRFASAFFGKGQFKGEQLDYKEGVYILSQKLDGPYYQPFPKEDIPDDGDWEKMDKEKRPKSGIQQLESVVTLVENNGAFDITIEMSGTNRVPVAVELAFQHGGRLDGVEPIPDIKDGYFFKGEKGEYKFRNEKIEFAAGKHEHNWTQLRGAEDKLDAKSVYVTGFTPFCWTLKIW